jgi:hypothetical protein
MQAGQGRHAGRQVKQTGRATQAEKQREARRARQAMQGMYGKAESGIASEGQVATGNARQGEAGPDMAKKAGKGRRGKVDRKVGQGRHGRENQAMWGNGGRARLAGRQAGQGRKAGQRRAWEVG